MSTSKTGCAHFSFLAYYIMGKNIVFLQKQLKFVNILNGMFVIINIVGIFALEIKQNIWMNHF